MTEAILMLYGPYFNENVVHPAGDVIFRGPKQRQEAFWREGLDYHIAMACDPPTPLGEYGVRELGDTPEAMIATNPVYSDDGKLLEANFKRGNIDHYPGIIDQYVRNFKDPVTHPDGTQSYTAHGLGLPNDRLWNSRPIQEMGNNKKHMDMVLDDHGVMIPTYDAPDLEEFTDNHGDCEIIYKPDGGARGKGIVILPSIAALKEGLQEKSLAANGSIQPYRNLRQPIPGLIGYTPEDQEKLRHLNSGTERVREVRTHVIATTNPDHGVYVEAYSTLKYSKPGTRIMQVAGNIALDPDCLGPGSMVNNTSRAMAKAVLEASAVHSGEVSPQYYGVFDWVWVGGEFRVVDGNCRGPALAEEAVAAGNSFVRNVALSARRVLANN